eukprot:jgi/Orpsp1_1/1181864/evm.model.c7180000078919.1
MRISNIFKKLIIILTLINTLHLISCQKLELATLTSYTRQDLLKINQKYICSNSAECPFGSYCHPDNYCIFEFICPEAENEYCMSLNITMWRASDEVVADEYLDQTYRPILKTCDYSNIGRNSFTKLFSTCYTEKCSDNNDCYSGVCEYETCLRGYKMNYRCGNQEDITNGIKCALNNQMPCKNDEECYSKHCNKGFCNKDVMNRNFMHIIFILLIITVVIIMIYKFKKSRKQEQAYRRMM